MLYVALELGISNSRRRCGLEKVPQQELGEPVAAGLLASDGVGKRALRGERLECEHTARELISKLVEVLPVVLESERERVFAMDPGKLVNKLQRVVIDPEGAIVGVTDSGEAT